MQVKFSKYHQNAAVPSKMLDAADAGFDLTALETVTIPPATCAIISTGICFEIPVGYVGLIKLRSGFSLKYPLVATAGVIDSGYRGDVKVMVVNISANSVTVDAGTRFAQMVVCKICNDFVQVDADQMSASSRNTAGFGSSDKK